MAELWYYTNEGKQMDPVTMKELKRLVSDGVLKPTDMVWKEGMARWIRASSLKELYPDPTAALDHFFTSTKTGPQKAATPGQSAATAVSAAGGGNAKTGPPLESTSSKTSTADEEIAPTSGKRRRPAEDADDDGRPPRRRPESAAGGSKIVLIVVALLAVGVLLVAAAGGVGILIWATRSNEPVPQPAKAEPVAANPKEKQKPEEIKQPINNPLPKNQGLPGDVKIGNGIQPSKIIRLGMDYSFRLRVKAGFQGNVTVTNHPLPGKAPPADFNIYVEKEDGTPIVSDVRPDANARVDIPAPPADEIYRVRVVNASKGGPFHRCTISYDGG